MTDKEYDFNSIVRFNADNDKNVSLQIGVYMGGPSFAVFSGNGGAPVKKIPFSNKMTWAAFPFFLEKLKTASPDTKFELPHATWDREAKKRVPNATLVFGRDDKNLPYIGVTGPGMSPAKFLIRPGLDFDLSGLDVVSQSAIALDSLINVFRLHIPLAVANTSFKRDFRGGGQGGGNAYGNRGGGNRAGGGFGGGNGGAANANQSAGASLEDEVVF